MMTQTHEDSGSIGLHTTFDPMLALGFFEEQSLFADCVSLPFDDSDTAAKSLPTTATHSLDYVDTNGQDFADIALTEVFDEFFGLFDLELDLVCSPTTTATQEQVPMSPKYLALSCEASEPLHEAAFGVREPLKKKKKSLKTSSQRQREEIASLRVTAARLEQDLQRIKPASRHTLSVKEKREGGANTSSMLSSLWEAVAKRQEAQKQRAELENVHLKKQLKANVALAESLERNLRKRKIKEL